MSTEALSQLSQGRLISLTTYRRDGRAVATPVGFIREEEHLLAWTAVNTGKVKRIRNNPQVATATCTPRGEVTGPVWPAIAFILPADEVQRVYPMLADKYEVMRTQRGEGVILQVTLKC